MPSHLTINVWNNTPNKLANLFRGTFFSPAISYLYGDNIGHLSAQVYCYDDNAEHLKMLKNLYSNLPTEDMKQYVAEKRENSRSHFKRREEKQSGVCFTTSFWPNVKPSLFQTFKEIVHLSDGAQAAFQSDLMDRKAEAKGEKVHLPTILHFKNTLIPCINTEDTKKPQPKNSKLKTRLHDLKPGIDLARAVNDREVKIQQLEQDIIKIKLEIYNLGCKMQQNLQRSQNNLTNRNTLNDEIGIAQRNLLGFNSKYQALKQKKHELQTLDSTYQTNDYSVVLTVLNRDMQKIISTMYALDHKVQQNIQSLKTNVAAQNKLHDVIEAQQNDLAELESKLHVLELEKLELQALETSGKIPDHAITLPTASLAELCEDDELLKLNHDFILTEMSYQRKHAKYHLTSFNCATSVKQCLLAGASPKLQQKVFSLGNVPKDFFKVNNPETPEKVFLWINKLNEYIETLEMNKLNEKKSAISRRPSSGTF